MGALSPASDGKVSRMRLMLLILQVLLHFLVGVLSVFNIHGIVAVEHGGRLVAGELHDDRGVGPCPPHVGIEGVAEIMEPEVSNACFLACIAKSSPNPLQWLTFISEDTVMA